MKKLPKRLEILFGFLEKADCFADVGCDHGYIAKQALDTNLCEKVVVSDISEKSLQKAVVLLKDYGNRVESVVCDGMGKLPSCVNEVLIAGIGGEVICSIVNNAPFLPKILVCQPMKNSDKLRKLLIEKGYGIINDTTIFDGEKFYDVIKAKLNFECEKYSEMELLFGRDNLQGNKVFIDFLNCKIESYNKRLEINFSKQIQEKIKFLESVKNAIKGNI